MPRMREMTRIARMAEAKALGKRLALARKRAGLTQVDVGRALRVPQSRIARLELGTRQLGYVEAMRLASLYGVKPGDFDQGPLD